MMDQKTYDWSNNINNKKRKPNNLMWWKRSWEVSGGVEACVKRGAFLPSVFGLFPVTISGSQLIFSRWKLTWSAAVLSVSWISFFTIPDHFLVSMSATYGANQSGNAFDLAVYKLQLVTINLNLAVALVCGLGSVGKLNSIIVKLKRVESSLGRLGCPQTTSTVTYLYLTLLAIAIIETLDIFSKVPNRIEFIHCVTYYHMFCLHLGSSFFCELCHGISSLFDQLSVYSKWTRPITSLVSFELLTSTAETLSQIYSPVILTSIFTSFFLVTNNIFFGVISNVNVESASTSLLWVILNCTIICKIIWAAESVVNSMNKYNRRMYDVAISDHSIFLNDKIILHMFMDHHVEFTGWGFVTIDRELLTDMLSYAAAYLAVLLQF